MTKRKLAIWIAAVLLVACLLSLFCSKHGLRVAEYGVAGSGDGLRIVQLTDLHGALFGEENQRLVRAVQHQEPDLIAMTGDMFDMDADDGQVDTVCALIAELADIAPVYYSLGNHEQAYLEANGDGVLARLEQAGAVVLEREFADIEINGQTVRIGGAYGYLLSWELRNGPEQDFMEAFTDTEHPTILLAHMSEGLLAYGCMEDWDVDLILSGHAHGGQIRLPLIGGLYDPETGWFPEYTRGLFRRGGSTLVLSAGLGTSGSIPRFNNVPEVVVVDILPE